MGPILIGVDITSTDRISRNINGGDSKFINRVFTKNEIDYCKSKKNHSERFAGRFAGKEAVSKALKLTWEQGINWKDIEIINKKNGNPEVKLHRDVKKLANEIYIRDIQISISHENEYAVAFVIMEGKKK